MQHQTHPDSCRKRLQNTAELLCSYCLGSYRSPKGATTVLPLLNVFPCQCGRCCGRCCLCKRCTLHSCPAGCRYAKEHQDLKDQIKRNEDQVVLLEKLAHDLQVWPVRFAAMLNRMQ